MESTDNDIKIKGKDERWRYPRFFGESGGGCAIITGEDAKHISTVLRMKQGELVVLCDNSDNSGSNKTDCLCEIVSANKELVELKVLDSRENDAEPNIQITLYQCLPKSDKMDFIVQKAVELGVFKIVPLLSKRCVSRPDSKTAAKKILRWQKIAEEAAKQCGRGCVPKIGGLQELKTALKDFSPSDIGILFYECGGEKLGDIISDGKNEKRNIGIFVGSEGGFEKEEAELAISCGVRLGTLGARILRCETAPMAALSILMNLTGNI